MGSCPGQDQEFPCRVVVVVVVVPGSPRAHDPGPGTFLGNAICLYLDFLGFGILSTSGGCGSIRNSTLYRNSEGSGRKVYPGGQADQQTLNKSENCRFQGSTQARDPSLQSAEAGEYVCPLAHPAAKTCRLQRGAAVARRMASSIHHASPGDWCMAYETVSRTSAPGLSDRKPPPNLPTALTAELPPCLEIPPK
jgi:hypothetical protein